MATISKICIVFLMTITLQCRLMATQHMQLQLSDKNLFVGILQSIGSYLYVPNKAKAKLQKKTTTVLSIIFITSLKADPDKKIAHSSKHSGDFFS